MNVELLQGCTMTHHQYMLHHIAQIYCLCAQRQKLAGVYAKSILQNYARHISNEDEMRKWERIINVLALVT